MPKPSHLLAAVALLLLVGCSTAEPSTVEPGTGPAASQEAPQEAPSSTDTSGAKTAKFGEAVVYPDRVKVEVTRIRKTKLSDSGIGDKGQKTGDPFYLLSIRVTNGSKAALEVFPSGTMTYGPDGEEASTVFDSGRGTQDMQGKILPGKAKTGAYGFAVPAKYAGDVQLEFSFSMDHGAAIFTGSLA